MPIYRPVWQTPWLDQGWGRRQVRGFSHKNWLNIWGGGHSGKGWKDYTRKLAKKAGLDDPTDDELRQFDRHRPGKKVSNDDWENPHDPDATITRMKNGTTRMAYKAEHAVALDTDIVVSTTVHPGSTPDTTTIIDTAIDAAVNVDQAGADHEIKAIVADQGYHSTSVVTLAADLGMRASIPERASPKQRRWVGKDPNEKRAVYSTRRSGSVASARCRPSVSMPGATTRRRC
jgi:transposase